MKHGRGQFWKIHKLTGVVPWPAELAPGEDVANVMAKPPFSALSMKLVSMGISLTVWRHIVDKDKEVRGS